MPEDVDLRGDIREGVSEEVRRRRSGGVGFRLNRGSPLTWFGICLVSDFPEISGCFGSSRLDCLNLD